MLTRSRLMNYKVCVLGAAGGIGQPLSMLLKADKLISNLSLYDVGNAVGVATDLSHVCTRTQVSGYARDELNKALDGCDAVIIPAGMPRKPGMTRDDLFKVNATIVKTLAEACAKNCPNASIGVISNPVNSTVPIFRKVYEGLNVYNPKKLFGVTTLDILRANTFVGQACGVCPECVEIAVVGGHSGPTIVPLISQYLSANAGKTLSQEKLKEITHRIQYGGDEVVKAKDGAGSATLSMAVAGARFTNALLRGMNGDKDVKEFAFVDTNKIDPRLSFCSARVTMGKEGIEDVSSLGNMSEYEKTLWEDCVAQLVKDIEKGVNFS